MLAMDPSYDTREGLKEAIKNGIPGLRELSRERHKAGYDRKESLQEWIILGLYYLDRCGNFSLIIENVPRERRRYIQIDDVMTHSEVKALNLGYWTSTPMYNLPPINHKCDRCGEGWSMRNIDPYRHERCHELAVIEEEREFFERVVARSEIPNDGIYAIPNGYSHDWPNPWFMIKTRWGKVKIGWRKRVICIEWNGSQINHNGDITFKDEGVTTYRTGVHAWGEDKAVEYLRILSQGNFE